MLGILFQLAISWLILYFYNKQNLNALGFLTKGKNYRISLIFFLFAALLAASQQALEAWLEGSEWTLNQEFTASQFFNGLWQDVKSVVFEELIFRGVLLYLILDRFGSTKAKMVSAVSFGIYHWFSFGIFGQIVPMIVIFGGTGLMGWVLAKAFIRSSSIWLPIAIHLGWNFVLNTLFSGGPYGEMAFIKSTGTPLVSYYWLLNTLSSMYLIPLILLFTISYAFPKAIRQE